MGWGSTPNKIIWRDFVLLLQRLPSLTAKEQEFLEGVFASYRSSGITAYEARRVMRKLETESHDEIERSQARRVYEAIAEALGEADSGLQEN